MGRVRTCCGCCDLAIGVHIVAGFTLAVSTLFIVVDAMVLSLLNGEYGTWAHALNQYAGNLLIMFASVKLGIAVLWFISAIFMIVGNIQTPKQNSFYVFWMVMTSIIVVIGGLCLLYYGYQVLAVMSILPGAYLGPLFAILAAMTAFEALWIYSLVVVGAHSAEIKERNLQDTQPLVGADVSHVVMNVHPHMVNAQPGGYTPTGVYTTAMGMGMKA